MMKSETNLFKKGSRCPVCTGCGRCFGEKQVHTVCGFAYPTATVSIPTEGYLVAADIGTTTIAMQLRQITDGKVADTYTCLNPQRNFGADVLSRIEAAEDAGVRTKLQAQVLTALGEGLAQFQKTLAKKERPGSRNTIKGMAIAANTTMIHLLMGYGVEGLGKFPFTPKTVSEIRTRLFAADTVILPGVSAFVGADVVAGVYALSMQKEEEISLLVDLGTNGEMVLGNHERMVATATAAGPAFEGGGEYFGTDLIKQVAALLEEGILDETGLLQEPYFTEGIRVGGVLITQDYIRKLQMAKAAIAAGIRILCKKYGLDCMDRVQKVYLAGGMGQYLDVQAAVRIGLLPSVLRDKTYAVGNAALEGAFLYAREVFALQGKADFPDFCMEEFNLAAEEAFADSYISGMDLKPCIE